MILKVAKEKNGITLIALVITIIVLLILAGVSIATLTGNNGILTRANEAKEESAKAGAKEKVEVEVLGSYDNNGDLSLEKLNSNLSNINNIEGLPVEFFPSKVIVDGYEVTIRESGKVTIEGENVEFDATEISRMGEEEVAQIYGKYVTNYNPTGNSGIGGSSPLSEYKWQVFYADSNNIYLISTDYINNPPNSTSNNITQNGEFKFSMSDVINDYQGASSITNTDLINLNANYYDFLTKNSIESQWNSLKGTAYMMDTNIWNPLFLDSNYADYAIGGPTIEMLFKSYNQKYGTNYTAGSLELNETLGTATIDEKGYYISSDGVSNWSKKIDEQSALSVDDTTYVLNNNDKATAYWIASPCFEGGSLLYSLFSGGNIDCFNCSTGNYGAFRPIVRLKSDVKIVTDGDNFVLK